MDPATASVLASGMSQMGQAGPSGAYGGTSGGGFTVEGMRVNSGASQWLWPAAAALVAIVLIRK